jgi:hypothetical protein
VSSRSRNADTSTISAIVRLNSLSVSGSAKNGGRLPLALRTRGRGTAPF